MREFKCKAWDKINKEMITNFWIDGDGTQSGISIDLGNLFNFTEFHDHIIILYTGLKDTNKQEISNSEG